MSVVIQVATQRRILLSATAVLFLCTGLPRSLIAQGPVISLKPGAVIHTTAGVGAMFFSGDNGPAADAALAGPNAVATDSAGNIYIADSDNHRVRRIDASGNITTFAGNGVQGFLGDGGPATSASLDTPRSVAVNPINGNLYIADSRNNVIRVVANGTISTFAGDSGGKSGYAGDGGPALGALLSGPRGVATDAAGNLYVADTNNHVIRMVSKGIISTMAGNGQQGYFGDNGQATTASLDSPASVFVDGAGNILISDTRNHRIREVSSGQIATVAGNGAIGFLGEGTPAIFAALYHPLGVAKDELGNVYIADTNNERVRRVDLSGTISTVAGDGQQGFVGDNGLPLESSLDTPSAVLPVAGHLLVVDKGNQRVRQVDAMLVSFADQVVGTTSAPQSVTVSNAGTNTLTLTSANLSVGAFAMAGGSCGTTFPVDLSAGSSCTLSIVFKPIGIGQDTSSLQFTDNAPGSPQMMTITGNGIRDGTAIVLGSSQSTTTFGQPVTLTAMVSPSTVTTEPPLTGSVTFADGANVIGSSAVSVGSASFATNALIAGSHTITASYSGDSLYNSSSTSLTQTVQKAVPTVALTVQPDPVIPGKPANFTATVSSSAGVPTGTVTFAANSNPLGTSSLTSSGVATLTATLAAPQSVVAAYSGDANFAGASSPALNQSSAFTLSIQPSTASIASGQSARVNVSITPSGGFNSPVSLGCLNLPAAASCLFSQVSLTPNGTAVSSTLTISTVTSASAGPSVALRIFFSSALLVLSISAALWFALAPPIVLAPRGAAAAWALLLSLSLFAIGCVGTANLGTNSRSALRTPPGTYPVTVTGSTSGAGAQSQSAVLTITVTP